MESTNPSPNTHSVNLWLAIIVIVCLVVGAAGEAVAGPAVSAAATTAESRVSHELSLLRRSTTALASASPKEAPAASTPAAPAIAATSQGTTDSPDAFINVVKRVGPAVVTVVNNLPPQPAFSGPGTVPFFGQGGLTQPQALGSGIIIDSEGHIVTNNHVVAGGSQFQVIFSNGKKVSAQLVGRDPISDIAVLKVSGTMPAVAQWGNSSELVPAQPVIAIGSALGDFRNTVTHGIISGLNRNLNAQGGGPSLTNLIQTDAPINHGNSGGPLLNEQGQVVGINTAIVQSSGMGEVAYGLGFAIPSNTAKTIADQLIKTGIVPRPFLGISYMPVSPQIASYYGLKTNSGDLVQQVVPNSPASKAGLRPGDVIVAINGQTLDDQHPLADQLLKHKVNDSVTLKINRGGQEQTLTATLEQRPLNAQ